MTFKKTLELGNGYTADCWKLSKIVSDLGSKVTSVTLEAWKNERSKNRGLDAVGESVRVSFTDNDYPIYYLKKADLGIPEDADEEDARARVIYLYINAIGKIAEEKQATALIAEPLEDGSVPELILSPAEQACLFFADADAVYDSRDPLKLLTAQDHRQTLNKLVRSVKRSVERADKKDRTPPDTLDE